MNAARSASPFLIRLGCAKVPVQQVRRGIKLVITICRDLVFAVLYNRYAVLAHRTVHAPVTHIKANLLQLFGHFLSAMAA